MTLRLSVGPSASPIAHLTKLTNFFSQAKLFVYTTSSRCRPRLRRSLFVCKKSRPAPLPSHLPQAYSPRITEGQFYEAQQQTRVVAARYIKSKTWDAAIDILFSVSQSLLKAGQGGSGGDLGLFLIDVYRQAELRPDAANKGKLLVLLRLFDSEEPTRKTFIGEMIG